MIRYEYTENNGQIWNIKHVETSLRVNLFIYLENLWKRFLLQFFYLKSETAITYQLRRF